MTAIPRYKRPFTAVSTVGEGFPVFGSMYMNDTIEYMRNTRARKPAIIFMVVTSILL